MVTWQWWRSRSSMLTAVVCSGMNRPQASKGQGEVVAEQVGDDSSDAVVGESAVEGVDEVGGGEVSDPVTGLDGGFAEGEQHVAFAGAGWSDQAHVLGGRDP